VHTGSRVLQLRSLQSVGPGESEGKGEGKGEGEGEGGEETSLLLTVLGDRVHGARPGGGGAMGFRAGALPRAVHRGR
jgi:hypothetical protein